MSRLTDKYLSQQGDEPMTQQRIQEWLTYWTNARMVAIDQINAFDQVHLARKYCSCMRVGVFAGVGDLAIWRALENMRDASKYPQQRVA
mgnify:CR=1 FL=1